MRLDPSILLRKIGKRYMIVKDGPEVDLTDVFTLNGTASDIWNAFRGREFTPGEVSEYLLQNYDVPKERAEADTAALLEELENLGLLQK
ncbi:MAG: PqqD family protein [Candidatus Cryptobacteroides sp.]